MPAAPGPQVPLSVVWANLFCLASVLAWSAGLPATAELVSVIPPLPLTVLRMSVAGAILVAVWIAREGVGPLRQADWGQGILVGAVVMGVGGLGMSIAIDLTDAVTVAIISAAMPIIGLAVEVALDGKRVSRALASGLVLGFLGAAIALDLRHATLQFGLGAAAALISVLGYVWGSRATVTRFPQLSALGRTGVTVVGAGISTGILAAAQALLWGSGISWSEIGTGTAIDLFLSAVAGVALAQTLWVMGVARVGIAVASMHNNAAPFYVMVIALAFGGAWNWTQALGAAIVILGVMVAQEMFGRLAWNG